jgi:hypothetical protein
MSLPSHDLIYGLKGQHVSPIANKILVPSHGGITVGFHAVKLRQLQLRFISFKFVIDLIFGCACSPI